MSWGQSRWIGTDRAATLVSASLVRPGATTHAFDQNQRFVPLTFTRDAANNRIVATLPANGNEAPPGDYMVFLVDSVSSSVRRVPSVAKWIRLGPDAIAPDSLPLLSEMEIACTEAWFTFRAYDQAGNPSPISALRVRTLATSACEDEEFICVHCSGGGGGNRAVEATSLGGPTVGAQSPSLLDGAVPDTDTDDLVPYLGSVTPEGGVQVVLRSRGARAIALDRVNLVAVGHDPDDQVFAAGGQIVAGRPAAVDSVWLDDSVSLPDLAEGSRLQPLALSEGQHLRVRWSGAAASARTLLVEAERPGRGILPAGAGIEVQVRDGNGAWQPHAQLHPRMAMSALVATGLTGGDVRLVARRDVRIASVRELLPAPAATLAHEVRATAAASAMRGVVRSLLLAADDQRADFTGPDTLTLVFEVPGAPEGRARSLFVGVQARVAAPSGGSETASQLALQAPPVAFALHQSRPNPARGRVTMPFDLPAAAIVRLEVFDTQGRRVHRQQGRLEAGRHEWSLGSAGRSLTPGVYTYRLSAGPHRGQRKLVVLP